MSFYYYFTAYDVFSDSQFFVAIRDRRELVGTYCKASTVRETRRVWSIDRRETLSDAGDDNFNMPPNAYADSFARNDKSKPACDNDANFGLDFCIFFSTPNI